VEGFILSENKAGQQRAPRKPNRLIHEPSPYLRQHAYNPVDWYPWGPEALERARVEDKPILLSIGYSACHWCHVMERESFDDEETAQLMNQLFVPIKVDREERPDLDQIYMDAVQLLSGRGGWPLTTFLTPDGKPFFGGTYFPPEDRHGLPGFKRVLRAVAQAYRERPQEIAQNVERLTRALDTLSSFKASDTQMSAGMIERAAGAMANHYDRVNGGIGQAPKFPNTFIFSLFLRVYRRTKDPAYAEMVRHTLSKMAKGGIHDHLGGGFHRYSVDSAWLVPHFEKMLYDNALLASLYLDAARALRENRFEQVARGIFEYVLREMTDPEGGFYSTQDADSEGEEGAFFLWTPEQVRTVLGEDLARIAMRFFDVSEEGNFEGRNILHLTIDVSDVAKLFAIEETKMAAMIDEIKTKLFAARETRVKPARDEKSLAAWNGLMISALAEGYRTLAETRYLRAAERAAEFVMTRLWDGRRLKRSFKDGAAQLNGYLEDYACVSQALIDLYEATLAPGYLTKARALAQVVLDHFVDAQNGGFFFTADDHEALITRSKPLFDGSTPSGNSRMCLVLLRLFAYLGEERLLKEAERILALAASAMREQPIAVAHMLEAADLFEQGADEIVLIGDRQDGEFERWLKWLGRRYLPNRAIFVSDPRSGAQHFVPEQITGKSQVDGRLTAYVCRRRTCSAPQTTLEGLEAELER
jgi:uncharacterized protein YyaL (SSP411 family)